MLNNISEILIKEWWNRPLPQIIPREIDLSSYLDLPVKKVVSLVGFRRVGKTYIFLELAKKIGQENCLYINFEDERIPKRVDFLTELIDKLSEITGSKSYVLLFDEIQNVPNWNIWARRITETTNHKLFITGSSSKLASSELPTELRGRSISIKVNPLNFNEFIKFKNVQFETLPKPSQLNLLREYLTYGGFPEVALVEEGKKVLIINEYFNTFVSRDIVERYKLRNSELLNNLIKLLLNSPFYTISSLTKSLNSIGFEPSKATISRYIFYLEESFFLSSLELSSPSVKKRSKAKRKTYFVDNSFIFKFSNDFSNNFGRLMENLVFNNLKNIYYWQNYQGSEIDFVVREKEENKKLIQVSFIKDKSEIKDREIKNLILGSKILKCDNLNLITWDLKDLLTKNGNKIKLIPIIYFLGIQAKE